VAHVVCRETQAEADAYYERYAVTLADHAAVDEHMAGKKEFPSHMTGMPTTSTGNASPAAPAPIRLSERRGGSPRR